jgi:hypothetical protein
MESRPVGVSFSEVDFFSIVKRTKGQTTTAGGICEEVSGYISGKAEIFPYELLNSNHENQTVYPANISIQSINNK